LDTTTSEGGQPTIRARPRPGGAHPCRVGTLSARFLELLALCGPGPDDERRACMLSRRAEPGCELPVTLVAEGSKRPARVSGWFRSACAVGSAMVLTSVPSSTMRSSMKVAVDVTLSAEAPTRVTMNRSRAQSPFTQQPSTSGQRQPHTPWRSTVTLGPSRGPRTPWSQKPCRLLRPRRYRSAVGHPKLSPDPSRGGSPTPNVVVGLTMMHVYC
jgi:hypothetical protein